MNRVLSFFSFLIVVGGILQSCDGTLPISSKMGDGIVLNVSSTTVSTKAGSADPEYLINSVYYFIYKDGDLTGGPVLKGFFSGLSFTDSKSWNIPVSAAQIGELFPGGGGKCHSIVVANPPADIVGILSGSGSDTLSLGYIRSLSLESTLKGV